MLSFYYYCHFDATLHARAPLLELHTADDMPPTFHHAAIARCCFFFARAYAALAAAAARHRFLQALIFGIDAYISRAAG